MEKFYSQNFFFDIFIVKRKKRKSHTKIGLEFIVNYVLDTFFNYDKIEKLKSYKSKYFYMCSKYMFLIKKITNEYKYEHIDRCDWLKRTDKSVVSYTLTNWHILKTEKINGGSTKEEYLKRHILDKECDNKTDVENTDIKNCKKL